MTCYRFLQRLRVSLRNWCHQTLPSGSYEVLIVNPHSPDGTHEHLAAVSASYPHLRIREIQVSPELSRNKGAMINHAIRLGRGEYVWLTDADCLFAPDCAMTVLTYVQGKQNCLFYGQRRYLTATQTEALLAGRLDALDDFSELANVPGSRAPQNAPWGYTQIVHRTVCERVPYRQHLNHFAHTDDIFVKDCSRARITSHQVPGLFCLHLDHPFSWYGTKTYL